MSNECPGPPSPPARSTRAPSRPSVAGTHLPGITTTPPPPPPPKAVISEPEAEAQPPAAPAAHTLHLTDPGALSAHLRERCSPGLRPRRHPPALLGTPVAIFGRRQQLYSECSLPRERTAGSLRPCFHPCPPPRETRVTGAFLFCPKSVGDEEEKRNLGRGGEAAEKGQAWSPHPPPRHLYCCFKKDGCTFFIFFLKALRRSILRKSYYLILT